MTGGRGAGWRFDGTITLGSIMTTLTVIAGLSIGWATIEAEQRAQGDRIAVIEDSAKEAQVAAERRGDATDDRIRALEIAQASFASDLRAIQAGINDIKAALERLSP